MNLVVIDCYDSFTFNLVHYFEQMVDSVTCIRNDKVDIDLLSQYDAIVLSPGPGLPNETKNLYRIIEKWAGKKPILGICLGHQAIGTFYGMELVNMPVVHHGIQRLTEIVDVEEGIFSDLPLDFLSARYHSWIVKPSLDSDILITAQDIDGSVMALRHKEYNVRGVQFHPESVLTEFGFKILKNWVELIG